MKKIEKKPKATLLLKTVGFVMLVIILAGGLLFPEIKQAVADATCTSISDCQQQIASNNNAVANLQSEATSYQDAINHLNAQIVLLQAQIDANVAQQAQLQAQIQAAQTELDQDKQILGVDVKAMYVGGQLSTVEQLATSKNLSDFVDAETYRSAVQNKIQSILVNITQLQNDLKTKKEAIDNLLQQQKYQQDQLNTAQAQQQQLLSLDQSQQSSYNAQTAQNQQKLNDLIAAQRRANSNASPGGYYFIHFPGAITADPANGSYPYANSGFEMSTVPGCSAVDPSDGPDPWLYCTRQCVSYAAWAVQDSGRQAPVGWGNAKEWVSAARNAGIPFDSSPEPGDVAISTEGTWGHAMYIEQVSGNQIYVSQYNQQLTGEYSTQWRTWE